MQRGSALNEREDLILNKIPEKLPMILIFPKQCKDFLVATFDPRQYPGYGIYREYRDEFIDSMKGFPSEYKELLTTAIDTIPVKVSEGSLVIPDGVGRGFSPEPESGIYEASEIGGEEKTKTVYVLLNSSTTITSRLIQFFTFSKYSHSSIALTRDGSFYSFNPKIGFTTERPISQKRKKDAKCILNTIEVTDEAYADIESRINWFIDNPDEYKFNYAGMVFTILRIPVGIENRYFCSQFISDLLKKSGALPGKKHSSRYLPMDLSKAVGSASTARRGTVAELSDPSHG